MGVKLRGRGRYLYSPTQLGPAAFYLAGRGDLLNASDTTALAGEAVKTWNDISGNGKHLTQGTSGLRPVMSTTAAGINGRAVPIFDGADDKLTIAAGSFTTAQPLTIIGVATTNLTQPAATRIVVDSSDVAGRCEVQQSNSTGYLEMYAGSATVGRSIEVTPAAPFVFSAIFNGASSEEYINGVGGSVASPGTQSLAGLTIGNRYTGTANSWNGKIGAIAIFSRALNNTERRFCEQWMADEFGVTLS